MEAKAEALAFLEAAGVAYDIMEHAPVYTMEDMVKEGITERGGVVKSLFLRDAKGKNHYLVVAPEDKRINLGQLSEKLGTTKLSFASAERLSKYLGVAQGAVSPLGVLHDETHTVQLIFEQSLQRQERIGLHPNDNTATLWLSVQDLVKLLKGLGNSVRFVELP